MQFVTVRDLRGKSAQVWRRLSNEKEIIITSNGKPIAILSAASEGSLEESLAAFRQARAIRAVASLQQRSVEMERDQMSLEDINAEIKVERKKRSK
ncbi:type II toxin-antitoxin system prevent-host-death family antitoxin [bacterium]|nr:type II toxin-antitoxin system prevent-host-death family antitoxin [bacterium]